MLDEQSSGGVTYLALVSAVIVAPLLEELIFRGILQRSMVKLLIQSDRKFRAIFLAGAAKPKLPIVPASPVSLIARYHGCQRKFSWTMNRTPAVSAASTILRLSETTRRS